MSDRVSKTKSVMLAKEIYNSILSGKNVDIKKLIGKGADVNYQDEENVTLLMLATAFNRSEIIEELIISGANTTLLDSNGNNILHYASGATLPEKLKEKNASLIENEKKVKRSSFVKYTKLIENKDITEKCKNYNALIFSDLLYSSNKLNQIPMSLFEAQEKAEEQAKKAKKSNEYGDENN